MRRISMAVLGSLVAVTAVAASRAGTLPEWCGGMLPPGQTVVLGVDADCGIIFMGRDSTLDLNGHTFTGIVTAPDDGRSGRYTIRGPGAIVGQGYPRNPCVMFYKGSVVIDGGAGQVTLRNCGYGVLANHGGGSKVTLRHVTVQRTVAIPTLTGIEVSKVDAEDLTIDFRDTLDIQRGDGVRALRIKGIGIVLRHVATGLIAPVIRVSNIVADDSYAAIAANRRADITGLTSTRHGEGIYGRKIRLTDSTLSNANPDGIDIGSSSRPLLVNTTCERSAVWDPFGPGLSFAGTWNVCTLD